MKEAVIPVRYDGCRGEGAHRVPLGLPREASKWAETQERRSGRSDTCIWREDGLFAKRLRGESYSRQRTREGLRGETVQRAEGR